MNKLSIYYILQWVNKTRKLIISNLKNNYNIIMLRILTIIRIIKYIVTRYYILNGYLETIIFFYFTLFAYDLIIITF